MFKLTASQAFNIGARASKLSFTRNMHLLQDKAFVNGAWVGAQSKKSFDVVNPATDKVVGQAPDMNLADAENAIDAAHAAFHSKEWQNTTAKERSTLLKV